MKKFIDTWFYKYIWSAIVHPRNFLFCFKYPFWKQTNVLTGKFMGYSTTWYEFIPSGWQKAFGPQLSEDIASALKADGIKKCKWANCVHWHDIKEKWGRLTLSASTSAAVEEVLEKYEIFSAGYCINCGKPVRYKTDGWIYYYCRDCMEAEANKFYPGTTKYYHTEQYRKTWETKFRVTKEDIPVYVGTNLENLVKKYDIDFVALWGLDDK